jgi:predicted metal-dependent hydrolase
MITATLSKVATRADLIALRAARTALVQRRRGARRSARELYREAHSLLRTLASFLDSPEAVA